MLNDIGPVIEPKGLARIKSYVGKLPEPKTIHEGAEILRRLFAAQFPKLDADGLGRGLAAHVAGARWTPRAELRSRGSRSTLDGIDLGRPLPPLWKEFDALARLPVMAIRGACPIFCPRTPSSRWAARHPGMATLVVPDQGHAPLLAEPDVIARIADFASSCERLHGR